MLSDEKMDRKILEHVKEHPVILPEDYQESDRTSLFRRYAFL